jgi:hypothetical protein
MSENSINPQGGVIIDVILETQQGESYQFTTKIISEHGCEECVYLNVNENNAIVLEPLTGNLESIADIAEPQYNSLPPINADVVIKAEADLYTRIYARSFSRGASTAHSEAAMAVERFRKFFYGTGGE